MELWNVLPFVDKVVKYPCYYITQYELRRNFLLHNFWKQATPIALKELVLDIIILYVLWYKSVFSGA